MNSSDYINDLVRSNQRLNSVLHNTLIPDEDQIPTRGSASQIDGYLTNGLHMI